MRVIDTYPAVCSMADKMGGLFQLPLWKTYAGGVSPSLPGKILSDIAGYDFRTQILPVVQGALNAPARMAQAHLSFVRALSFLSGRFRPVLGEEPDVDILLYFGLCSGAGWATRLDGRPAVLLGLEKIVELGWEGEGDMAGLLAHEIGHLWHQSCLGEAADAPEGPDKSVWPLWEEGLAMVCEQELCGRPGLFHQDKDGWLDWCRENRRALHREYLRRALCGESVQDFFGDWVQYRGHSDIGYFLGCDFVRHAAADCGLRGAAETKPHGLAERYRRFVDSL